MAKPQVEIIITADDSKLKKVARNVESELKRMAKDGSLGALAIGAAFTGIGMAMQDVLNTMDQISKMSSKTGFSVESLSALKYAAELSDITLEQLEKSFVKLNKSIDSGSSSFARMNVNLKDGDGKLRKNEEILLDVAESFKNMEDGARKTAIATELFGKSGADMIPLLNAGKEGINDMMKEADLLGITFDSVAAKKAEAFNDAITTLTNTAKGFITELTLSFLPVISDSTDAMNAGARSSGTLGDKLTILQGIARGVAAGFYLVKMGVIGAGETIAAMVLTVWDGIKYLGSLTQMLFQFGKGDFSGGMTTWDLANAKAFKDSSLMWSKLKEDSFKMIRELKDIALGNSSLSEIIKPKTGGSDEETSSKTKEEKKNEYTVEEKLNDLYKEKALLAKDELEKAKLNLELKGKLYDLAMKSNATDEEKKKVWLELLQAQQEYVKTEDEAIKKRKDEITKRGTATFAKGEKRQKDFQDLKKESSSKLEGLDQENQVSGVPDWMKDQVQLEIDYRKALNEVEVSNHLNKEAQKLEIEEKYAFARLNIEQKMQEQKLAIISNAFASAGSFLAKNTLLYKVMATVQATLDTYLAASLALRSFPPPFGAIAMGTAIATGLANVATIQGIEVPGYATGGFALVGEKGPEIIAPMQDYASGQVALINAVMSRMGNISPGEGLQKFEIRGDNLVTINDRNKHIKARKAW